MKAVRHNPVTVSVMQQSPVRLIAHVFLPTLLGTAIYLGWRSESLLVFSWADQLGIRSMIPRANIPIPHWLHYCFPDGCWAYATTSWMLIIWSRPTLWALAAPLLGVASEVGQLLCVVPGTFDHGDIIAYLFGSSLAALIYAKTTVLDLGPVGHDSLGVRQL